LTVHYGSGTDSGEDVYLNRSCTSDFGDVRFTDDDGSTLLDYWLEEKTDGANATFWVEVADDLTLYDVTIYVYYGNGAVSSVSSGVDTFLLFDDFVGSGGSAPNSSVWAVAKNGSSNAIVDLDGNGNLRLAGEPDVDSSGSVLSLGSLPANNIMLVLRRMATDDYYRDASLGSGGVVSMTGDGAWYHTTLANGYMLYIECESAGYRRHMEMFDGVRTTLSNTEDAPSLDVFHREEHSYLSNGELTSSFDGGNSLTNNNTNHLNLEKYVLLSQGEYSNGYGGTSYVDWVFVRRCVATEPDHGDWGAEESMM
jgi:hypothetical protein